MLLEAIYTLGGQAVVYDPDPQAPAAQRVRQAFCAPWDDVDTLQQFAHACDVVTYEFENVEAEPLHALATLVPVFPSPHVLLTTQNRLREKQFLQRAGLPHVHFVPVEDPAALERIKRPAILKTARGGYDGKGQWWLHEGHSLPHVTAWPCVAEEPIEIAAEVSAIVGRRGGRHVVFPIFENRHQNHILDVTTWPAQIPPRVEEAVRVCAARAADALDVQGLLTVEFFLSRTDAERSPGLERDGWSIYVNEMAPRPHNSGHLTRNAATASQFDVLARILMGLPLHEPRQLDAGAWAMANLLGDVWASPQAPLDLSCWARHPAVVDVTLYGKAEARPGRKMGHCVARGATPEAARAAAVAFRDELKARQSNPPNRVG